MAERNYSGFLSEPVRLNTADLNLDRSGSAPDGAAAAPASGAMVRAPAKRNKPLKKSTARKPGRGSGAAGAVAHNLAFQSPGHEYSSLRR